MCFTLPIIPDPAYSYPPPLPTNTLQTWGLNKYHGGRSGSPSNWPGVDLPPLEIFAESFLVHFHSDGSINDYGFRLTAEGSHPVFPNPQPLETGTQGNDSTNSSSGQTPYACEDVSPWPMYLGQPPPHASCRKTLDGALLARVGAWNRPLSVEEVEALAADPPPDDVGTVSGLGSASGRSESSSCFKETAGENEGEENGCACPADEKKAAMAGKAGAAAAAQVLALAHACCRTETSREEFLTLSMVGALLRLVLAGDSETRGWALRVCRLTLPRLKPSLVDHEFRCVLLWYLLAHATARRV